LNSKKEFTDVTPPTIDGKNVIYITLDPTFVANKNGEYKYFFVGDGIRYSSNVGVFSSDEIWVNKGFKTYDLLGNGNTLF